jgi:hypothetical protein
VDIKSLIDRYREEFEYIEQADLDAYKKSESIEYLLKRAIVGLTHEGKRDSHKYRRH